MTNANEATVKALEAAFKDVAFRANRLREWMEIEIYLRSVEARVAEFNPRVQSTQMNTFGPVAADLAAQWNRNLETDVLDLQRYNDSTQYLKQPLSTAPGTKAGPYDDIQALVQLGDDLYAALNNIEFQETKRLAGDFTKRLKALITDRRLAVGREVDGLCELTVRLQSQLGS